MENVEATPAAEPVAEAVVDSSIDTHNATSESTYEPTAKGAIDRAFAKIEADSQETPEPEPTVEGEEPEVKAEEAPKTERERNPDGTFKAKEAEKQPEEAIEAKPEDETAKEPEKEAEAFTEAPNRFSPDAKAAWKDAPLPVRAEINRALEEMQGGLEQYRQAYEPFREFAQELQQTGQQFGDVLANYRGIEQLLETNFVQGLDVICQNKGVSLRDIAAKIAGQTPDEVTQQTDQTIHALRQEIAQLKQGLTGVHSALEQDRTAKNNQIANDAVSEITAFANDSNYPRFEELRKDMAMLIQSERAKDLQEAYGMAERLNPVATPEPIVPAETPAPPANQAQTPKGDLSLSGAPGSGSNPTTQKRSGSPREAVDNAFAQLGV